MNSQGKIGEMWLHGTEPALLPSPPAGAAPSPRSSRASSGRACHACPGRLGQEAQAPGLGHPVAGPRDEVGACKGRDQLGRSWVTGRSVILTEAAAAVRTSVKPCV